MGGEQAAQVLTQITAEQRKRQGQKVILASSTSKIPYRQFFNLHFSLHPKKNKQFVNQSYVNTIMKVHHITLQHVYGMMVLLIHWILVLF